MPSPLPDLTQQIAHPARMYDFYLGGKDHYTIDRTAAEKVLEAHPSVRTMACANRAFMHRATEYVARRGITQFLDIGTGLPTEPNLHQIAQQIHPAARVVYVDNDPLVAAHGRAMLVGTPEGITTLVRADLTDVETILSAPQLTNTLDLTRPVALSLIAVLHFLPDERKPLDAVTALLDALAPGSYLVLTHATADFAPERIDAAAQIYRESGIENQVRTHQEVLRFFDSLDLVEHGLTVPHRWRMPADMADLEPVVHVPEGWATSSIEPPAARDADVSFYAGVAHKPAR